VQPDVLSPLSQYELNTQNNNAYAPTIIQASGSEHVRDFSIAEPGVIASGDNELNNTPFVPSSSFSYYLVQDSTKPTKELESVEEKSARESMHKALKALDEIDWNSIEKGLKASGEKIDIKKVREELKKLLKQVDWQKVDIEGKLEALKEQTKVNELKFYNDLKKIVQSENGQMPEHFQNMQKKIIDDQLKCQQDVQKKELELKRYLREKKIKVRKIVEI